MLSAVATASFVTSSYPRSANSELAASRIWSRRSAGLRRRYLDGVLMAQV